MEYNNRKMSDLKSSIFRNLISMTNKDFSHLEKIINPKIVEVQECFILDLEGELKIENINWERVMKFHKDKTGYEASCNELRINDYVNDTDITREDIIICALQIMDGWENQLRRCFPEHNFLIVLSCDDEYATLRFHKERPDENNWLNYDLEKYKDQAIMVKEVMRNSI
ncbi:hypothetical protein [Paenibacillus alvei]|uniref:hypothetical protein n=1 Tax=Paenibacillus alvei TaxID=44250 RepID=UPI00227E05FD|nr:hypothetical protein [Paenibacillus alvei]